MRTDIRIRIRGGVIRIRINETCIRTVIRVTAEQDTTRMTHLLYCYLIVFLFKIISVTVTPQSDLSGELIHFLDFLQDIKNVG